MDKLADAASMHGADNVLVSKIRAANTAMEAFEHCRNANIPLADVIARQARETAMASLAGETEVDVIVYDRTGARVGTSHHAR